jgi:hypothetical protein
MILTRQFLCDNLGCASHLAVVSLTPLGYAYRPGILQELWIDENY